MELPSCFRDFLKDIRLSDNQVENCITGHETLRSRLKSYEDLKGKIVNTFLQGSYRRSTAVRPANGARADVDVVVVTNLNESDYPKPDDAINLFVPFLDKYYEGKYKIQNRSIGISLSYVDLDLVITSAPSEVDKIVLSSESVNETGQLELTPDWRLVPHWVRMENRGSLSGFDIQKRLLEAKAAAEWKSAPLRIPDRERKCWENTHPLAQLIWTRDKNGRCNSHYINVVKALRWWKRINLDLPKYPKGYPLEHLIGLHCPDNIKTVAEGIVRSLENIVSAYHHEFSNRTVPYIVDHGVEHNVFGRVTAEDFAGFYECIVEAASIARSAYDADTPVKSSELWRKLFGNKFPESISPSINSSYSGPSAFETPTQTSQISNQRYANLG
jgi:Second Messenger Oligonucleotide or Dinucleotide Synthetase domain